MPAKKKAAKKSAKPCKKRKRAGPSLGSPTVGRPKAKTTGGSDPGPRRKIEEADSPPDEL